MCAGAVAAPFLSTSAGMDSMISMSRSVAVSFSRPLAASISTFDKIGIVLRRSTTLWTCPSAFKKAPRSTLIFIAYRFQKCPRSGGFWRSRSSLGRPSRFPSVRIPRIVATSDSRFKRDYDAAKRAMRALPAPARALRGATERPSHPVLLELAPQHLAQEFDLLLEHRIALAELFDPPAGMQHRCVVAAAETPADIGQRAAGQFARQEHRHLARPRHTARAPCRVQLADIELVELGRLLLDLLDRDPAIAEHR